MSASAIPTATPGRPFGRVLTAMVTPFDADGAVDLDRVQELATRLVDLGNDGIVVNGTTGESPTTSDLEKADVVRAVADAVGDRAVVVAGASTYDTRQSVELAQAAEKSGAHGLLLVTPYYSRPGQEGVRAHLRTVADATDLPVMLYDIPGRTATALSHESLLELAEHPRIVAVKDAKGDLYAGSRVIAETGLAYYSGDDPLNLPWLSVGAVGCVSVVSHVSADRIRAMTLAYESGDVAAARRLHEASIPLWRSMERNGGVVFAKAALAVQGFGVGSPRLPLLPALGDELEAVAADLTAAGIGF